MPVVTMVVEELLGLWQFAATLPWSSVELLQSAKHVWCNVIRLLTALGIDRFCCRKRAFGYLAENSWLFQDHFLQDCRTFSHGHRSGSKIQGDKIKEGRSSDLAQWKLTCEQRDGHAILQVCNQTRTVRHVLRKIKFKALKVAESCIPFQHFKESSSAS